MAKNNPQTGSMGKVVVASIKPAKKTAYAWTLAADLVPKEGVDALQSDNARALARKAMRGRSR